MTSPAAFSIQVATGTAGAQFVESQDITDFVGGQPLWLSMYYKATRITGTDTVTILREIEWFDSGGASLTSSTASTVVSATVAWGFVEANHTVPSTAVKARVKITLTPSGANHQFDTYVTGIRLTKTQTFATAGGTLGPGGNITGAVDGNGRALIDFTQASHLSKNVDNIADGATYGRPILTRLNAGKPVIDFSEGIHSNKNVDNLADGSTYGRPLLTRLSSGNPLIDFSAAYHVNKTVDNVADGSTYGRPLLTRLNAGKPVIDFTEAIHTGKNVDNLADGSTYGRPLLTRLNAGKPVIDFSEGIHSNKSLANVDSSQDTKLNGIQTGATANIARGTWSAASVAYALNDLVYYGGALYINILAYTSSATTPPNDATHWTPYSATNLDSLGDGSTYGRPLLTRLSSGNPLIDFSAGYHVNKTVDNVADGSTYGRPLLTRLNAGKPVIDFTEAIHTGKNVDNMADGSTYGRPLLTRLNAGKPVIDFSEAIHSNKSLASVDSSQDTKLTGIATGATKNTPRGTWSAASVAYAVNDLVYYSGSMYINILAYTSSATTPPNDATHWTPYSAVNLDSLGDGSTYGRPLATRLNAGKPVIDFSEAIHSNKSLANVDSTANTKLSGIAAGATVGATYGVNTSGFGTLAGKSQIDLSTTDVATIGSIPPMVPSAAFSYTASTTACTVSWPALTIYRPDGTTISVTSGSQSVTGMSFGTYRIYPYLVDSGGTTGTVVFSTTGTSSPTGTPAICWPSVGDALAASAMYLATHIALNTVSVLIPSSGTSAGGNGGFTCPHPSMRLGDKIAEELKAGDLIPSPSGRSRITSITRKPASTWIVVLCGGMRAAKVTPDHRFLRPNGQEVRARDVRLGQLLATDGDHAEVTGLLLEDDIASVVSMEVEEPHLYYLGPLNLLCHNTKYA